MIAEPERIADDHDLGDDHGLDEALDDGAEGGALAAEEHGAVCRERGEEEEDIEEDPEHETGFVPEACLD